MWLGVKMALSFIQWESLELYKIHKDCSLKTKLFCIDLLLYSGKTWSDGNEGLVFKIFSPIADYNFIHKSVEPNQTRFMNFWLITLVINIDYDESM